MARDQEKDKENIRNACSTAKRLRIDDCIWALLQNDKDQIAKFRIIRRNLEAKCNATLAEYEAAADDEARLRIVGGFNFNDNELNPPAAAIAKEKTAMLLE